jgi:26S proteasome regulatory subunit N6
MAQGESARVQEAQKLAKSGDARKAEGIYREILATPPSVTSDAAVKEYESALISLGELYRDEK